MLQGFGKFAQKPCQVLEGRGLLHREALRFQDEGKNPLLKVEGEAGAPFWSGFQEGFLECLQAAHLLVFQFLGKGVVYQGFLDPETTARVRQAAPNRK